MLTNKEQKKLKELEEELRLHESIKEEFISEEDRTKWVREYLSLVSEYQILKLKEAGLTEEYEIDGIPFIGLKGMKEIER